MEELEKLYKAVSSNFDIGTFEDFNSKMQTPDDRKRFYDAVKSNGFDLGDYAEYENRLKKKDSFEDYVSTLPPIPGTDITSEQSQPRQQQFVPEIDIPESEIENQKVQEQVKELGEYNTFKSETLSKMDTDTGKEIFNRMEGEYKKRYGGGSVARKLYEFNKEVESLGEDVSMDEYKKLAEKYNLDLDEEKGTVSLYPTEAKVYNEIYEKSINDIIKEKQEKEKDPYMKDVWRKMNVGAGNLLTGTYATLGLVTGIQGLKDAAEWSDEQTKKWQEQITRQDADIAGLVMNNDIKGAIGQSILQLSEQIPQLTALAMGNYAGYTNATLGFMGASATGSKYTELKDEDMPEFQKILVSVMNGLNEISFEKAGTINILNDVKRTVTALGKEEAKKRLKDMYYNEMHRVVAGLFNGTSEALRERASEWATEFANNLVEKSMVDPSQDVFQNTTNSFIIGMLMGKGMSIPVDVANVKNYLNEKMNSLPENFPEENKMKATELLVKKDKLKKQQDKVDEAFQVDNTKKIEDINTELQDLQNTKIKEDEKETVQQAEAKIEAEKQEIEEEPVKEEKKSGKKAVKEVQFADEEQAKGAMSRLLKSNPERTFTTPLLSDGKEVGDITVEKNEKTWDVKWVEVKKEERGSGLGKSTYRKMNELAQKEDKVLQSDRVDKSNPGTAGKVWESLVKSGEAIKTEEGRYQMKPLEAKKEVIEPKKPEKEVKKTVEQKTEVVLPKEEFLKDNGTESSINKGTFVYDNPIQPDTKIRVKAKAKAEADEMAYKEYLQQEPKIKEETKDAVQEQSTTEIPIPETPETGKEMGEEDKGYRETAKEEVQKQEVPGKVKTINFESFGEPRTGEIIEEGDGYIKVKDNKGITHTIKEGDKKYTITETSTITTPKSKSIQFKGQKYDNELQLKEALGKKEITKPEYERAKKMLNKKEFNDAKERLRSNLDSYFTKQAIGEEKASMSELFDSMVDFIKKALSVYGDKIKSSKDVAKYMGVEHNKLMNDAYNVATGKKGVTKEYKMRKFPKRVKEFEEFKDMKVDIEENPELYYTPQNLEESKEMLGEKDDVELLSILNDKNSNLRTLAAIELMNRYRESGKDVMPIMEQISKDLTMFGQLIRQAAEIKGTTPESITYAIEQMLATKGRYLTEEQRAKLTKLAQNDIDARMEMKTQAELTKEEFTEENVKKWKEKKKIAEDEYIKLAQYIQTITPADFWDIMGMTLQGNLLTPMSQVTNIYANLFNIPLMAGANIIATPVDALHTLITGKPRTTTLNPMVVVEGLKRFGYGLTESIKQIKTGIPIQEKAELARGFKPVRALVQAFTGKDMPVNKKGKIPTKDKVNKFIEGVVGMPAEVMFRLLNLGDKPFYRMGEGISLYAIGKNKGLKGKELEKFIRFPDMASQKKAIENAEEITFQEHSITAKSAQSLVGTMYKILSDIPVVGGALKFLLRTQMPYVRTPANIISQTLDIAIPPISFAKSAYYAYKGDKRTALINMGKGVIGVMLGVAAKELLENGIMSGSPDEEPKKRQVQYEVLPPNSLNLSGLERLLNGKDPSPQKGDEIINYTKMGIIGMTFGVHANIHDRRKEIEQRQKELFEEGKEKRQLSENAQDIVAALIETPSYALEQSFLKGTSSLLTAINDKKWDYWLTNTWNAVTSIPLPNTLTAINRMEQEYIPEMKGEDLEERLGNVIKNKTFRTDDLPLKINMWGEPIKRTPEGNKEWFYQLFDVTKHQQIEVKPESKFIYDLYVKTQDPDVLPSIPNRNITVESFPIKLDGKEYESYLRETGQMRYNLLQKSLYGGMLDKMTDEQKINYLGKIYKEGMEYGKNYVVVNHLKKLIDKRKTKNSR